MDYCFFTPDKSHLLADAIVRFAEAGDLSVDDIYYGLEAAWRGAYKQARLTNDDADYSVVRILGSLELTAPEYSRSCCDAHERFWLF